MSTREIILDTETTGMDPAKGERIVEIGCIELINLVPTGRTFHKYLNPEKEISAEVVAVHGLDNERLKNEPLFVEIAGDLVDFIGDANIVAHNAFFDIKFINAELARCGYASYEPKQVVDTLMLARKRFPGAPASLDALCKRFGIDNSNRTLHGALLDAQLLADVYLELKGGKQAGLGLDESAVDEPADVNGAALQRSLRPARSFVPTADELEAHQAFIKKLTQPLWLKQQESEAAIKAIQQN